MSTKCDVTVSESVLPSSQVRHEIEWIASKIDSLRPKLQNRPRTLREMNDLFRQSRECQAILDYRAKKESEQP